MKSLYSLILTAGSRIDGQPRFGSEAEEVFYAETLSWLKQELREDFIKELPYLGFVIANLTEEKAAELNLNPSLLLIEKASVAKPSTIQLNAGWALEAGCNRIDNKFSYIGTGEGVTIYVVDTGINASLSEFSGRVRAGFDYTLGDPLVHDHGSTVAACAAGVANGVAKKAEIVDVRVGNDLFYSNDVLDGINWILSDHTTGLAVVNMSYETSNYSATLASALAALIAEGVVCVASAGNTASLASTFYPGNYTGVICVGAIQEDLDIAYFSNTGPRVDILAPGRLVRSVNQAGSTIEASGTSLSSGYVAGAIACVIAGLNSVIPSQALAMLKSQAFKNTSIHTLPTTTKDISNFVMVKEWFGNTGIVELVNPTKKYKLRAYSTDGVTKTYIQDYYITPQLRQAITIKLGLAITANFATHINCKRVAAGDNPVA